MRLRIGTRPSRLALAQAREAINFISGECEIVPIATAGDKDKTTSLEKLEGSDFFTREITRALLNDEIDIAVHSAKDLEDDAPQGLVIAAMTESIAPCECLVSKDGLRLDELEAGTIVGTSSKKRKESIFKLRPDLIVKDIRGDIDARIAQLDQGNFDAIIIAHAALIRLKLEDRIAQIFSLEEMPPHPLQGRLAIQICEDREDLLQYFNPRGWGPLTPGVGLIYEKR